MLSYINKLNQCFIKTINHRYKHTAVTLEKTLIPLKSKKLVKVEGEDVPSYLQGLITNDMKHFESGAKSMFTMFLNNKGRVLLDTLVYKWININAYLIECDAQVLGILVKHLKMYKLRRKLDINEVSDHNLWVLLSSDNIENESFDKIKHYKDPRLADLGYRLIVPSIFQADDVIKAINKNVTVQDEEAYIGHRFKLGISEGATEHPPATCFPLEINCDYLHGVSFHKGCYIGQEVTARVHHTGVVRKRIMPLKFKTELTKNLNYDSVIMDRDIPKSNYGKIKGVVGNQGIGLVRVKEAMESKNLVVDDCSLDVFKPHWWPFEAPKEKSKLNTKEDVIG